MINNSLDNKTIESIKASARQKLVEYSKLNDVIGAQIFSILEHQNKVLYYPLEDDSVWGFSETIKGKSFVCINTSIPYDKQVFTAAHELYHLWFEYNGEVILSTDIEETNSNNTISINEMKANRFAAEFLINEELLNQEIRAYALEKNKIDIRDVLILSNLFVVPYKTMVNRLFETKIINKEKYAKLVLLTNEQIEIWRNRIGLSLPTRENKIGLNSLVDKAMELYEKNLISRDKLEHLLGYANLNLEQMGIPLEDPYVPPTDDELDVIMED